MNKAVLLSLMVYPGAGHLFLRRFRMGIGLLIIATGALSVMIYVMVQRSFDIIDKIQRGEIGQMDVMAISDILVKADSTQMQAATSILLVLWVVGIADTYRVTRKDYQSSQAKK